MPTSILCSTSTFAGLTETDRLLSTSHSAYSSRLGLEKAHDSDSSQAAINLSLCSQNEPQENAEDCDAVAKYDQTQCSNSTSRGVLLRRHSATRCWYWPQKLSVLSTPFSLLTSPKDHELSESVHMTEERVVLGSRFLKRHKTITGISMTNRDVHTEVKPPSIGCAVSTTAVPLQFDESQPMFWRSRGVVHFRHSVNSTVSPCGSADKGKNVLTWFQTTLAFSRCLPVCLLPLVSRLLVWDPNRFSHPLPMFIQWSFVYSHWSDPITTSAEGDASHLGQSCTSGAEASHDDTEKEVRWVISNDVFCSPFIFFPFYMLSCVRLINCT